MMPIYLDNHSTTRVDPRVVQAMLPYFTEDYGNAGSTSHPFGWQAKQAVDESRSALAAAVGAKASELIFTSGATESNNLALRGLMDRRQQRGRHLITLTTEHRAVLDPLVRLERRGFEVTRLDVLPADAKMAGRLPLDRLVEAIRPDTALVSVMLANNEIGVIQPLEQISAICHAQDVLVHCDATQAVGKIPVDVTRLDVDLMSFSAHKLYGPKGIGALVVRRRSPQLRPVALIDGGGQEKGLRSGTLPVPLIVGFAAAVALCLDELPTEQRRLAELRDRMWSGLRSRVDQVELNGPTLDRDGQPELARLPHNLNVRFQGVDGESLMLTAGRVAMSSGSACTSANPEPSHVLRALGLDDDQIRSSVRMGLGRFNTSQDVDEAIEAIGEAVDRLRQLGGSGPASMG